MAFIFRSSTSSRHTTYVPTLLAKPTNSLYLVLVSIFKPTWWMSTALRCLHAIKRTHAASMLPLNSRIPLRMPPGAVVEGQVEEEEEEGGNGSSATLSHK